MSLSKPYLVLFNLLSCASWAYVLYLSLNHLFVEKKPSEALFDLVHIPLAFAQSLAILEVLHSVVGIVRSPWFTTAMQVASRITLVWGITEPVVESRYHWFYALMVVSWSLTEIPRYLFYAVNLVGEVPSFLKTIRYSTFIPLYPSGITGEVLCILKALPAVEKSRIYSVFMPNSINFAFDYYYFLYLVLATYVPGSYIMYTYMLAQRKKQLAPANKDDKKKQ